MLTQLICQKIPLNSRKGAPIKINGYLVGAFDGEQKFSKHVLAEAVGEKGRIARVGSGSDIKETRTEAQI